MTAAPGHDLHEFYGAFGVGIEFFGGDGDVEALAKFGFLSGYSGRAIIGIANTGTDAADGLHGRVCKGDSIGSER